MTNQKNFLVFGTDICYITDGGDFVTLAEKLKQLREQRGMTQKQVAALMGISQQAYGQYESGTRLPKPETLGRIAAALDSTLDEITQCTDLAAYGVGDKNASYMKDFINGAVAQWSSEGAVLKKYNSLNPKFEALFNAFDALNDNGQSVAVERVQELAQIPAYQRPTEPAQDVPNAPGDKEPAEK